jgi:glycosyltransferase involved in cell wall biosynthesis
MTGKTRNQPESGEASGAWPRVAVLMSTYNGERYLRAQLDSLAAQQGVRVELIVRDDGSSDATIAILREYSGLWPRLAQIAPSNNIRPAASFLTLLKDAPDDFDFYAFSDQDDIWLPDKLQRAAAALEAASLVEPVIYYSGMTCVSEALVPLGDNLASDSVRFDELLFENAALGCTIVLNSPARKLIAGRSPRPEAVVMHDWWSALVVTSVGRAIYDDYCGVLYRQHGANSVGADTSRLQHMMRYARKLLRDPRNFHPVHRQAAELLRLYGDKITSERRRVLEALVASNRSLPARLGYALSGPVKRRRKLDELVLRGLVAAGWY